MKNHQFLLIFLLLFISCCSYAQSGQKKIALIIGAQNYTGLPKLRHSLSDARDMSTRLKSKGFLVESLFDPKTKREIKDAINRYFNLMRDNDGAVGIIFYAGHGMQYEGENYIIPTTATLQNPGDLEDYCVRMNTIMAVLKSTSKSLNILLLDACRSLPSFSRDSGEGLSRINAPQGTIIVFATQPGKTASDGVGKNGLFTSNLLKIMDEPDLNMTEVFKRVKMEVYKQSEEKQLPSVEDNTIGGDFYFTQSDKSVPIPPQKPQPINSITNKQVAVQPKLESLKEAADVDFGYGVKATKTVSINNRAWASKNLNLDYFANGAQIIEAKTSEEWAKAAKNKLPAWCHYDEDPANGTTYGKLYNWYAVASPQGLCPTGWHVPSDEDWSALTDFVSSEAGKKLKASTSWPEDGNGTDNYNFAALPAGFCNGYGYHFYLGTDSYWWSSTGPNSTMAWSRYIGSKSDKVDKDLSEKAFGLSVRCIKD